MRKVFSLSYRQARVKFDFRKARHLQSCSQACLTRQTDNGHGNRGG